MKIYVENDQTVTEATPPAHSWLPEAFLVVAVTLFMIGVPLSGLPRNIINVASVICLGSACYAWGHEAGRNKAAQEAER